MHQRVLKDTIKTRNPHRSVQQPRRPADQRHFGLYRRWNGGDGSAQNRVVLPANVAAAEPLRLGHELVHAFQYNMIINGDSTFCASLATCPWMVEAWLNMSIGSVRCPYRHVDAGRRAARDDVPTKDLQDPSKFSLSLRTGILGFPDRIEGDDIIEPFFLATAKYGLEAACLQQLSMSQKTCLGALGADGGERLTSGNSSATPKRPPDGKTVAQGKFRRSISLPRSAPTAAT